MPNKWTRIKRLYNLTQDQYEGALALQGNSCAICRRPYVKLYLDHSHLTGQSRGHLCFRCNKGLALFSDRPDWLRFAANYLDNPPVSILFGDVYGLPGGVNAKMKYKKRLARKRDKNK